MKKLTLAIMAAMIIFTNPCSTNATETYIDYCEEIGGKYNICPELIQAIVEKESNYNPNAHGASDDTGLMQIIPKWNRERMKRLGVTNLYDPYQNILCGTDLIAELAEKYGDPYLVLMCYNEGEYGGAIKRYESGNYSDYAVSIMERAAELENAHGKHDY